MKHFPFAFNRNKSLGARRSLRQNANSAEQILWKFMRNGQLDYKFRRQFDIKSFVADFYCHELRLVIELDGWTHEFEKTKARDVIKQRVLESVGCQVLRITNEQVFGDIEALCRHIAGVCKKRANELRVR